MGLSIYTISGIWVGVITFGVTWIAGLLYTYSQPVAYEAQARIWVQPKLAEMVPSSMQTSLYAPLTAFFNSPITTAGEVLKSDIVLQDALKTAKTQLPSDKLPTLDDLRMGVSVTPVNNADILIIRFRFRDAKASAVVLQDLLDAFINENSTQSSQSATQSRIFLEKQLQQAQQLSLQTRQDLKDFQDENKTVDLQEQTNHTLREISDLKSSIEKARSRQLEQQSKILYLQSQLKISPDSVIMAQRLSRDEEIKGLRLKIAADQVRYIELQAKLRPEHPRMQQLQNMLVSTKGALKERITALMGTGAGSAESEMQLLVEDPVQQKLMADMVDARAEEISQETEVQSLTEALNNTRAKLKEVPAQQLKLAELTRAAEVASRTLSDTERNLHSTRLLESVASKASNIQILDRPQVPGAPANSKVAFGVVASALLGLVLGTGAFIAIFLLNPAVRSVKGVLNVVPLPLIGWIERMPSTHFQDVLPGLQRIRVNLRPWLMGPHCRIIVTSGDTEDGKTILSAGLALSLAQAGTRVCLVDANLAHPSLHEVFALPPSPGVAEFLKSGSPELLNSMLHTIQDNLQVVTAGKTEGFSGSFDSPALSRLLEHLESQSDVSIIDTGAVSQSEDPMVLMNTNSRLLVVARLRHTTREALRLLAAQLKQLDNIIGGIVLFNAEEKDIVSSLLTQSTVMVEEAPSEPVESTHW